MSTWKTRCTQNRWTISARRHHKATVAVVCKPSGCTREVADVDSSHYAANELERLRSVRCHIRHRAGLWLRNPRTADSVRRGGNASAFGEVFGAGRFLVTPRARTANDGRCCASRRRRRRRRRRWRRERALLTLNDTSFRLYSLVCGRLSRVRLLVSVY